MPEQWFYVNGEATEGPLDREALVQLTRIGTVRRDTLVWRDGLAEWVAAGTLDLGFPPAVPSMAPAQVRAMPPVLTAPVAAPRPAPATAYAPTAAPARDMRSMLGGIGAKISEVADLPTISNINVKNLLMGGLSQQTGEDDIEEIFVVGTGTTTPPISMVQTGWPSPRVFWRVLGGCLAAYVLMRVGLSQFNNANFIPGIIIVGSFGVPLACVILFFECNTPKNVSIYQVFKMVLIGGALSLLVTLFIFQFIPGAGTGQLVPALLTGAGEETGKMLALILVVRSMRYPWQLNGILFGAAVGAGFAGFESAGYAYRSGAGLFDSIMLRAILSPGGHVIWTAMVGAAIWRVKGNRKFELSMLLHPIVVRRWAIAVVLHGLWDASILAWYIQLPIISIVGWYLIFAMLKQAYEGLEQVKVAAQAAIAA
ncbi:MAG: PrsW family glutamic-type intramembrane protease [Thermoanaerobaculia bacterium]